MIGRRFLRWLLEVPDDAPPPAPTGPVVLELEPVYPNGATGALFREALAELELRATTDDPAMRQLYPATFVIPLHGATGMRVRVRRSDVAGLYAGATTTVERESEPPPSFLRGSGRG